MSMRNNTVYLPWQTKTFKLFEAIKMFIDLQLDSLISELLWSQVLTK